MAMGRMLSTPAGGPISVIIWPHGSLVRGANIGSFVSRRSCWRYLVTQAVQRTLNGEVPVIGLCGHFRTVPRVSLDAGNESSEVTSRQVRFVSPAEVSIARIPDLPAWRHPQPAFPHS